MIYSTTVGLPALVACLVIFVPMMVEASIARRHERRQIARGGIEPSGDVYNAMRFFYPGLMLAMIVEGVWRDSFFASLMAPGAVIFVASKLLKWWAMATLGDAWTFRVIVVPGAALQASGPYRLMRHPNYVAVVGEFIGAALITGALIVGPIAIVVFGALMLKRIAVEERALGRRRDANV